MRILFLTIPCLFAFVACSHQNTQFTSKEESDTLNVDSSINHIDEHLVGHGFDFELNGKDTNASVFKKVFIVDSILAPDSIKMHSALKKLLFQRNAKGFRLELDNFSFSSNDINNAYKLASNGLFDRLITYQIQGEDARGNVHFTGYFTPLLNVKAQADSIFEHPIYAYPKGDKRPLPTREQIDINGALKGRDLELAFAENLFDVYTMQVQGSGIVEFENGTKKMFRYSGNNGHKYNSIGRYLVEQGEIEASELSLTSIKKWINKNPLKVKELLSKNPSYVFFEPSDNLDVIGAEGTPLKPFISVAADPEYLPLGSLLIIERPVLNEEGILIGKRKHWAIVQDVGGAIKGPGHIDVYCGLGEEGKLEARALHHYGKVWLVLPK